MARGSNAPVIILGNQKAGTSAIAGLLGEASGQSTSIDLRNEISLPTFQLLKGGGLDFERFIATNRLDFSRQIVKEPNLSLFYPELLTAFPDARFVFIVREPRDNVRSILNRLKIPGDLPDIDPAEWPEISPAWQHVVDSRWAGIGGETYIARLAHRWRHIARVYLAQPHRFLLVRYEDFRADKLATIHGMCEALELPVVADISGQLDRSFQRPGKRDTDLTDFFGPNYRLFDTICSDEMRELGYGAPAGTPRGRIDDCITA
ncbi:MAG: sulfotransferase [Rhodocyclaceae bacterium]|nr:sulfotransferase [Rhodocyclaceae bacterium]